ncbi:autotransporter-associated beta strand repeat-containing protein [Sphingobium sp.]|uniref:autotransporter-associated beta strand repeat-containing protein n=1 Tax=Sphingobium sp. TaxID=1912891 RepID=UPI0035C6926D
MALRNGRVARRAGDALWAKRFLGSSSLTAMALLALASPARADDVYWDANGAAVGSGGTGNWDLTSSLWSQSNSDVLGPFVLWSNNPANPNNAIFGVSAGGVTTTPGTITLTQPITAHNLTFQSGNGWALGGGTLTLGGVNPTITTGGSATINSVIAGTAGLVKAGGSTLTLTGANGFSGGIVVNAGTLIAATDAALGAAGNNIATAAGATVGFGLTSGTTSRSIAIGAGGTLNLSGAGAGSALITGTGNVNVGTGVTMSNDANSYDGVTRFSACNGVCSTSFTSIGNLGEASSLGAPTTVTNGTIIWNQSSQYTDNLIYLGDGDVSDRDWIFNANSTGTFINQGTGALNLTGDFAINGLARFVAQTADFNLSGVISGGTVTFSSAAGRQITVSGLNTFTGAATVQTGLVNVASLANAGVASALGAGTQISLSAGILNYVGGTAGSDRTFVSDGAVGIRNSGTGALTLSGPLSFLATGAADTLTFGGSYAGTNEFSGVITGTGMLGSTGTSIWRLTGANTRSGAIALDGGTLQAGNASAFGKVTGATVNGGTLDLNGYDLILPQLSGTGGSVALNGGALLTVTGLTSADNSTYGGSITGNGGLLKRGTNILTLTGQSSYTGGTTVQGGTIALDFSPVTAPADDILSSASTLTMAGGTLSITGAAGEVNSQSFAGLDVTAGTNRIVVASGSGGTMNVDLGTLDNSGGLMDFTLPTSGIITAANPDGTLGWATINGKDYAQVSGGVVSAFAAYANKDDASSWLSGDVVSDAGGAANTAYFGTVSGSQQLGGLQYTAAQGSVVTIGAGNTLGIDGTIIVSSTVGATGKEITGGSLTGAVGGGTLGFLHNGTGNFLVSSRVVDNGGDAVGVTKAGTGRVTLNNVNNSYTGATTLSGGTLTVASIGNGGANSAIGASSADASNLVLESGTLSYIGGTATSDRGFTLVNGGPSRMFEVANGAAELTFTGLVTSPDDAGLTKTGGGTLTLSNAANDYTGITRVENGVLSATTLADGGQLSSIGQSSSDAANLVLLNGGTLRYTGATVSTDRGITLENAAGRIDVAGAATDLTVTGPIIGAGRLEKYGDGTLVLTGANSYTGITVVNAGTLRAGAALGSGSTTGVFGSISSTMTVNAGGTLDLADNSNQIGALNGGGNVTLGTLAGTTLTIGGANSGDPGFTGSISGAGNVTHTNFTQVMTGCGNSYTGITTLTGASGGSVLTTDCIRNGGVNSGIGASGSDAANLVIQNGAVLNYSAVATDQITDRGFTLASGAGVIQVADAATTLTFTGAAVGPGALTKRGAGTLILSGDNSYTGQTAVEAGRLVAGSAGAFDQGTGILVVANAADAVFDMNGFDASFLQLQGGGTTGGTIDLGDANATLTVSNTGNNIFAGAIVGTGNLIKSGAAVEVLSGCDSSYNGITTIRQGTLQVNCLTDGGTNSSIGASSSGAGNLVLNGGTLRYVGGGGSTDRLFTLGASASALDASGTGAITFTNTGPIAFSSPNTAQSVTLTGTSTADNRLAPRITDNGTGKTALSKTGVGTWILTNQANTYTGATSITGGVLGVDKLSNGGVASSIGQSASAAANLVIGTGATLRYTGGGDMTDRQFTLGVGTTAIESVGTGAVVFSNTGAVSYQGNGARVVSLGGTNGGANIMGATIGNQGANVTSLAKNGSGTWILTGNNSFTGSTVINDGNLVIGNGGTSGNAGTGNVNVTQASSTLSFNRSDAFNFTGTISGPGAIAQIGSGTTILTALNSIGAARIDDGALQVNGTLQSATFAMNGDGALIVNGVVEGASGGTAATFSGDAGASAISVNAPGVLRANGDLGDGADAVTLAGLLDTGGGALNLGAGADRLTLNDGGAITGMVDGGTGTDMLIVNNAVARTLDGGQITGFEALSKQNGGTLTLTGDHAYSAGTTISAGTLSVGNGGTSGTLAGNVVNNGALLFNRSDASSFAGNISGTGTLTKLGGGALTLTGDATHMGGTLLSQGALSIGNGGTTGSISGDIINNASLNFNRSDAYDYAGSISGTGSVTTRTGTVSLTGDSSWSGGTSIVDGSELRIAAGNEIASGGSTIINDGTLTVAGAGSTFQAGTINAVSASSSAIINVASGGTLKTTTLALRAASSPANAQLNISGAGSLVELSGALNIASSAADNTASVIISDGGTLRSTGDNLFGSPLANTTDPLLTITGAGSNWTSSGNLVMRDGSVSLLDGGVASFNAVQIGTVDAQAQMLVSGAGSVLTAQDIEVGALLSGRGVLTIADGGRVSVGGTLAVGGGSAGADGTVNIGGAGSAAAAAGMLDAATIAFGPGSGTLNLNHTDAGYVLAGAMSGSGAINQLAGVTRLTGTSAAFTGQTAVSGGTLLVDGTLGGAASVTNVLAGGTLGGSGTIGGNVSVANGGALAPGSLGVGALSIGGDLSLAPGAAMNFEFGQANAPGSPLNDVVNVGGNLALGGTLNVAVSPGGSFDIGLYRLFNYAGALTDGGAAIGALPAGVNAGDLSIQTAIAGQVNLINANGVTLNFWDGATGPKFNSAVNGGSGVWQNSGGNDNWTDQTGTVNAAFSDNAVAIFSAAAGIVTVDDSLGAVSAGGMQFASDGYLVNGDAVTLANPQSVIRVGDGTAAGAAYGAAIDAVLAGSGVQLVKTDLGTLTLGGVNSYSGGTLVNGGTLRISADANLGGAVGGLTLNGGALNTSASFSSSRLVTLAGAGSILTDAGTTLTLAGPVSGPGALTKNGEGTLVLTGAGLYLGGTTIAQGTLRLGDGGTSGSIVGDVLNNGALAFDRADVSSFDGVVSGVGRLDQLGTGTTILTGANSYAGGTLIGAGTLQIGDGGTAGSIVGNVVTNGTLAFDRSDEIVFAGLVSGTGGLNQIGAGTTILTGANSYGGTTHVAVGTLLVNGDQSAATGLTSVVSGATLGGIGVIGGDVSLVDGAIFAPGDATGPGTLTINGALGLSSGTRLVYDFGQSNVVGGPLNDLTQIGGALTLDGTIDVSVSPGGSFDVGLYRVMSYGGTLTDNGLALGALPAGTLAAVQTAVAGQVNLINATGTTLNFWDGAAGPKANGIVNGGDGVWQSSAGNDNWTEISGAVNAAFSDSAFAIFAGAPGAVTVDNGLGAVTASGLQFASDGYVIGGDAIGLSGPQSVIRVGDGTAAGLGYTAIIDSALTGGSELVKTDLGTLILNGTNSYTGGTRVNVGTLQISRDANLGDAAGGISFDGGTLRSTASITSARNVSMIGTGTILTDAGTTLVLNGSVTGSGDLIKDGSGNLALNDTSDHSGMTIVRAGGLFVNGDQSAATGLVDVGAGATLGGRGIIGGDVAVADGGTLAPGNSPGTLTINGNLALGSGSLLAFEFGQANVAGGALNDLVNVGGDLVLDGTLNVSVSAGGTFGGGVYRVFNYGGTLTDNGLALGTMPSGSELSVQTVIAGQVNLVNTAGLTLNFWDGQAGPKNNGTIDGGNGIWRVAGGNNNWTESQAQVNADYAQNSFAVFAGASGVISVDNSGGAVESAGMQFAVDGYRLDGDALTLTGSQAIIRVGDGTAAGADYTATIVNALTGAATLVKTDGGTLVLNGVNSYSGGTAIDGGTLRIASDANLGDAAGALSFDGGTLNTTLDLSTGRAVNLVGTGTLLTDAGTSLTLTGALAGNGALVKSGAGTLVLNGSGGQGGGTNVTAGALLVNGDYAAATGLTAVAAGASLGGSGTIGGDVTMADGAILTPGAGATGTLTIGGDLSLSAGTRLAYEFGQAGVAGGALNDLVNVGGDLMLDGLVDVTVPAGGAFDVGVYRLFNYAGALTNNGLTLGSMPMGSDVTVQTSITGQVNLVNAAGLMLNFWDGAAGPKNDGAVNGGNGVWQNGGGNDNWTDASGGVNAAYQDGGFAIFAGTGGAVSVDNGLGQVTASGMQFAATGYTIGGGSLDLTGPATTIRVGDGSAAGAAFTATVNAVLTGDTQLVKTDAGTLVLGAANGYTGGTLINGGTVQVSADANLGAAAGAVTLDGGTLATSADLGSTRDIVLTGGGTLATMTGTSFTYGGLFSGTGALTKAGAGSLLVSGDSSGYTGATTVAAGMLALNGALGGTVDVQSGARLEGSGSAGALVNRGVVAPGNGIGSFTVQGDYQGVGGVLEIEAELGGDASAADRLVVNGATSGTTQVIVTNRGGLGAQTVEGIKIADVAGASGGSFTLRGDYVFEGQQAVIAGAYGYRLYQGGVSTPADGDWYLRSATLDGAGQPQGPLYQPGVPVYESYGQTLQALSGLATMQERVGNRQWAQSPDGVPTGIWGRMESSRLRPSGRLSTTGADTDIDSWKAQIGVDHMLSEGRDSVFVAGLTAHYGEADASIRSRFGSGTIDTKGYGLGATLTWFGADGFYADAQAQWSWFDSKLKSVTLGTLADDNHGKGEAISLELGKSSIVGHGLTLTPQIQMAYQNVSFDAFTDPFDARVSSRKGDSLKTRWGISIDHRANWDANGVSRNSHIYALANLSYEWLDGTVARVSGAAIANAPDRLWGEVALGGTLGLGRVTLYMQASGSASLNKFGESYGLKGVAGARLAF